MISRIVSNPLVQLILLISPIILGLLTIQPMSQFFFPPPIEPDNLVLQISYDSCKIECIKRVNGDDKPKCSQSNNDLTEIVLPNDKPIHFEFIVYDKEGTIYRMNEIQCRWLIGPSELKFSSIEPCEKSLISSNGFSPPYFLSIEVDSTGKRFEPNPVLTISYNIK